MCGFFGEWKSVLRTLHTTGWILCIQVGVVERDRNGARRVVSAARLSKRRKQGLRKMSCSIEMAPQKCKHGGGSCRQCERSLFPKTRRSVEVGLIRHFAFVERRKGITVFFYHFLAVSGKAGFQTNSVTQATQIIWITTIGIASKPSTSCSHVLNVT